MTVHCCDRLQSSERRQRESVRERERRAVEDEGGEERERKKENMRE